MKQRLWHALAVMSIVLGGVVVTDVPAQATPSNCQSDYIYNGAGSPSGGWAHCYSGSGSFRVLFRCDVSWWPDYTRYGPWRYSTDSTAFCDKGHYPYALAIETRET
jgi:hypothetical protein